MRADDSPRKPASAGRARRYTSWVRSSASARSPSRAHTRQTSGCVRRTNAVDRHPVARARREGQPGELVHPVSLVAGNQPAQSGDLPPMRCDTIREALSARLDGEATGRRRRAHRGPPRHLPRLRRVVAEELATLHRMVRVREAEAVPDLVGGHPRRAPGAAPGAASPLAEAISPARWALFVVALTQLVLAAPALLLGEDAGATVHVARELGSFDVALAIGLLVAAWQPARAWGLLPVVARSRS